ncbi:MAG: tetratricopeptide repeat protein [Nocardioides sp.]
MARIPVARAPAVTLAAHAPVGIPEEGVPAVTPVARARAATLVGRAPAVTRAARAPVGIPVEVVLVVTPVVRVPGGGDSRGSRPGGDSRGARSGGESRGSWGSSAGDKPRGKSEYGASRGSGTSRDGRRDERSDDRRGPQREERSGAPRGERGEDRRRDDRRGSGRDGGSSSRDRRDDRGRRDDRRDDRSGRGGVDRGDRERRTEAEQAIYDGPPLPDSITGEELDRAVSQQLRGLPDRLAQRVARHLAAAGDLIDTDPEVAYQHALAARARASRLAVVREAVGETAYAAGHYTEALAELRAAKRMNGATAYLPIMADCHRALGHPEQALKLARSEGVANFSPEAKAEMTIVEAGARADMGQLDAALRTLELSPLTSATRAPWVVRLRYAYADTLEKAGRTSDALAWFHRAHAIDAYEVTDAEDRAAALEAAAGD